MKERGIRTAVLSNKGHEEAVRNIETVFGAGCFDRIAGEQEGIPRKPDPAGALYTAKALGVRPEECLYLGDSNTDMRTGIAAGMDTVGVTWGFRSREELESFHPRYLADDPRRWKPSWRDRPRQKNPDSDVSNRQRCGKMPVTSLRPRPDAKDHAER